MLNTVQLSRLMKLSWKIQYRRRITRKKALEQAWAILNNEDLAIGHLTRKLNHNKPILYTTQRQYTLFDS